MQLGNLLPELKRILDTAEPAALGPERRPGTLSTAELDAELAQAFPARFTPAVRDLFTAGAYLWHDHLDAAHQIAQSIETADGSLLHGIMHRREPDYGNAKYWFRRVGSHPSFLSLAVRASELLEKADESDLHSRLLPNKTWDPFAFVDAVEDAAEGQFKSKVALLRQV
ncbi:MAG: hypothetical protein ACXW3Z_10040, partial [Limisphaerales bacterium]